MTKNKILIKKLCDIKINVPLSGLYNQVAACNAQQVLHSEQDPNNMEEIKDHRHIETWETATPKNYRPISLLCHTYKLYERLILNRIAPTIEEHLIKEQAGFRPGKSCTSQLLNLTQHIEDGYQFGKITGTAFVDLSAAYDTVNHIRLIQKLYNTTQDSELLLLSTHSHGPC